MKIILMAVLCAMALCAADSDTKQVLAAMESLKQAMIHRDGAALEKLLSDDLTYTHSAGQEESKADVIKSITSGKSIVEKLELTDTIVRINGNTALVKGKVDLWHSSTNIVNMNVLHVWVKHASGWQMVARQATRLAK